MPAFKGGKVLAEDAAGHDALEDVVRPITVGDLMMHTAGFTYGFLLDSPVCELYRQAQILDDAGRSLSDFVAALAELPLAYQPGSRWHYSVSIDVAAHLLEILADRPLRDVLKERLFVPLGMVDTDFGVPEASRPRLAGMYGVGDICAQDMTLVKSFEAWQAGHWDAIEVEPTYPSGRPNTFARGGHGLFSTTQDYLRFALMLLNAGTLKGTRILGRKTVELMHANHVPHHLLPYEIGGIYSPGYGFGLGSRVLMDVGLAGQPGTVDEFGWAGAASTYYWVDPIEEMVGVFMTQYQGGYEPDKDFRVLAYQAIVD